MTPLHLTLWNQGPYGLKVQYKDSWYEGKMIIATLTGVTNEAIETTFKKARRTPMGNWCNGDIIGWEGNNNINDFELKPILRRLSDLDKEITHNGERFVPMDRIRKLSTSNIDFSPMSQLWMLNTNRDGEVAINVMSRINELLDQWHFNRRNLPDSDFIPVTNEFNPY